MKKSSNAVESATGVQGRPCKRLCTFYIMKLSWFIVCWHCVIGVASTVEVREYGFCTISGSFNMSVVTR